MTARRVAIWVGLAALALVCGAAFRAALGQTVPTPTCTTHYILLGRTADRVYVELTVPPDGVCVLDVRRQAARRRKPV